VRLVLATRNPGKVRELRALAEGFGLQLQDLTAWPDYRPPPEEGTGFAENARIKATAACRALGAAALADDSGLVVARLGGRPGVHSARYAGPGADDRANRLRLLAELRGERDRRARFVAVLALALPDGRVVYARGELEGEIAEEERGHGGFGYDPVFFCPQVGCTLAELEPEAKNRISHRARALAVLAPTLRRLAAGALGAWA
jgi:XTP/dITP diphosphohydrolase